MLLKEVRSTFVEYFQKKHAHVYVHSSPTIPHDDPTLLFANAGMNQFKPIFLGNVDPSSDMARLKRAVNSQKCIRAGGKHNDLDDVGKDLYHHTFFEMLGNWSFGDYFKDEICSWSWDLLTNVYKLPKDRLYVTYFGGEPSQQLEPDLECRQKWLDLGVPAEHILPGSMKDNFWEMGDTGPCGPCSEIHFDRIGGRDASSLVNQDDPDVLEIWNLVFIQFNRESNGQLKSLPKKHIDCGLGLERLASIMQDKRSNYDTDAFLPIFVKIQELTGARPYTGMIGKADSDCVDMAYRVLADHARTLTVALSDGGMPDNVGRGYVLRRILRRAVRFASEKLGAKPGVFAELVDVVVDLLQDAFPELAKDSSYVKDVINEEERQFLKTLERGRKLLHRTVGKLGVSKLIPGDVAWRLYDTYGFPVDLTQLMAEENDLNVDMDAFETCKKEAQERSRGEAKDRDDSYRLDVHAIEELKSRGIPFTDDSQKYDYKAGNSPDADYSFGSCLGKIVAIRMNGHFVEEVKSGDRCGIVTDRTCFYAESGGQLSDEGFMVKNDDDSTEFKVENAEIKGGFVCHVGVVEGTLKIGDEVAITFDGVRRKLLMNNHTGTHILNFALRQVLSADADQKGSLVAPDRLRFDFSSKGAMTVEQVKRAEQIAVEMVKSNSQVYAKTSSLAVAKSIVGLRAVFGEVYPDPVRVVSVGIPVEDLEKDPQSPAGNKTSIEFCGGTHLLRSGHVGHFVIAVEEAIAKGIRRIVALTGPEAQKAINRGALLQNKVNQLTQTLSNDSLSYKESVKLITDLMEDINQAQIQYWLRDELRNALDSAKKVLGDADRARKMAVSKDAIRFVKELKAANPDVPYVVVELKAFAQNKVLNDALKEVKNGPPSLFISADEDTGKILAMAAVPKDVVQKGLAADQWVKNLTELLDGKGGGRAENAQLSGTNTSALHKALRLSHEFAQQKLSCPPVHLKTDELLTTSATNVLEKPPKCCQKREETKVAVKTQAATDTKYDLVLHGADNIQAIFVALAAGFSGKTLTFADNSAKRVSLVTSEGRLEGALASASFVAPADMCGKDPVHKAQVLSWMITAESELLPLLAAGKLVSQPKPGAGAAAQQMLERLNRYLRDHTFLVGERLSMADVSVFASLLNAYRDQRLRPSMDKLTSLTRWFNTVLHQPPVQTCLSCMNMTL
ncbi:hypothetical protein HAZT_HAZT005176 [Hyalella azteca]|uniref:Alanine--tRNA ligase n=1 Tax=Hyalella azteca TaxID=294128 RepID=A0A6A0H3T1_HYAAZ|nr:alanine--tRNA ligase, cytoplasmic [Hyalella azteca]KAA0198665.1 hypothetical protein HAZT_HAZT005176 [Hyalella azteca]